MGPPLKSAMPPRGEKEPHTPHLSTYAPLFVVSAVQPAYSQPWSSVQPQHPLGQPHIHAPHFHGTEIDQLYNKSEFEVGESSAHSKPTNLPMYSKNPYGTTNWQAFASCNNWQRIYGTLLRNSIRRNASRLYTLRNQVHDCKQGTLDATSYFNKLFLLWQEMDLSRKTVWDTPSDDKQYARLEEADQIYDFLIGLNPMFDIVCGRILSLRPRSSLMEVCYEVHLEEDHTSAMSILTTPATDSAAFSVRSSTHDSEQNNEKPIPIHEHCMKQCTLCINVGNFMVVL
ncbi:UBN2_3 domain-containing protein [Cucumis melo var. makuwa]|uniref:UBN2_3 domain-containing protein n=1 Tax=Cucumis melo var. makuwa TaxID=1194695 RepID=A0A5A7UKG6_CUCMM|nr:UBN2_3 domain-containing protein [Cucumis melo var. makuwa]